MFALLNSEGWLKYIGDRNVKTVEQARQYLTNNTIKSYKESGFGFYKVTLKSINQPVGIAGLVKRPQLEHEDLGFAFLPEFQGLGLAYEAAKLIVHYAQNQLKLSKLTAIVQPNNVKSIKLLKKLGMQFEKTVNPFNEPQPLMLFSINFEADDNLQRNRKC